MSLYKEQARGKRAQVKAALQSKWKQFYLLIVMAITTGASRGELEKLR